MKDYVIEQAVKNGITDLYIQGPPWLTTGIKGARTVNAHEYNRHGTSPINSYEIRVNGTCLLKDVGNPEEISQALNEMLSRPAETAVLAEMSKAEGMGRMLPDKMHTALDWSALQIDRAGYRTKASDIICIREAVEEVRKHARSLSPYMESKLSGIEHERTLREAIDGYHVMKERLYAQPYENRTPWRFPPYRDSFMLDGKPMSICIEQDERGMAEISFYGKGKKLSEGELSRINFFNGRSLIEPVIPYDMECALGNLSRELSERNIISDQRNIYRIAMSEDFMDFIENRLNEQYEQKEPEISNTKEETRSLDDAMRSAALRFQAGQTIIYPDRGPATRAVSDVLSH